VKIEIWQIENSPFAPKFEIISKPNDWTKAVRSSTDSTELTDTKIKQLEFWTQFKDFAKQRQTRLHIQKNKPQHWINISIGSSEAHVALTIHSRENQFGIELYIPDSKELYQKLFVRKSEIEAELGEEPIWMDLPNKKASRIRVLSSGSFEDMAKWEDTFEWLITEAEKFQSVFPKYIRLEE